MTVSELERLHDFDRGELVRLRRPIHGYRDGAVVQVAAGSRSSMVRVRAPGGGLTFEVHWTDLERPTR